MSKAIKPNEQTYVHGHSVANNSDYVLPERVILLAAELRTELIKLDLPIKITVDNT
ncbi:TPA: hypothetical protein N2619_004558 [Salmonella enterica]|uniref:Uncharacterized protein n=1 Tax=Acinetobacter phage APK15 TaxID=2873374 RepID=A0AAE8XLF8_9CAUD|nr:hypothetical protein APK15_09 [Acinetobacter phage APK15]HCH8298228.1 hypothetical protein [Salmonella enterica]HCH9460298.1 hypothetical protein [Salmonella enterica]HCM0366603.1 hypothetical protein [Salmonella enterica]